MNKTVVEALDFLNEFLPSVNDVKDVDIVIAPAYTALLTVSEKLRGSNVALAAQNVFYEEKGAYTGEVSTPMLKDAGCSHVIIGHSERRHIFGENDDIVNKKIKAAVKAGLLVIFCIGETLDERKAGKTFDVLNRQISGGLREIDIEDVVIAYEPVWAIGTGVTATPEQAEEAHAFIRREVGSLYGDGIEAVRILYGGSVTPDNVAELMAQTDVDGALVGGASLKPDSFTKIVKFRRP